MVGDCPAFQDAIEFQPEVVMEAESLVLLHNEDNSVFHASPLLKLLQFKNLPLLLKDDWLHQRRPSNPVASWAARRSAAPPAGPGRTSHPVARPAQAPLAVSDQPGEWHQQPVPPR